MCFSKKPWRWLGLSLIQKKRFPSKCCPLGKTKEEKTQCWSDEKRFFPLLSDENRVSRTYRKKNNPISEKVDIERYDSKQNLFQKHKIKKHYKKENSQNLNPEQGPQGLSVHRPYIYTWLHPPNLPVF